MVLLQAVPLYRGFGYDPNNQHFIAASQIVSASFNKEIAEVSKWINVKLIDGSEWQISRDDFNVMVISTDRKGN